MVDDCCIFVPWQAVKSVRTALHEPDYYLADGKKIPIRRTPMDVVLDVDPRLASQRLKEQALISGAAHMLGVRAPLQDTCPWIS